jgi:hypothetical protein
MLVGRKRGEGMKLCCGRKWNRRSTTVMLSMGDIYCFYPAVRKVRGLFFSFPFDLPFLHPLGRKRNRKMK